MKIVSIITTALLNDTGTDFILGGNERYLLDMIALYNELGYKCHIFQPSRIPFEKKIESNIIVGVPFKKFSSETYVKLNKYFRDNAPASDIYHYQSFVLAYPHTFENSIGICHGISWDKPIGDYWESNFLSTDKLIHFAKKKVLMRRYRIAAKQLSKIIANDTNFVNWSRVDWPEISAKINYIPNYVDLNQFVVEKNIEKKEKIQILFPRRLSRERGFLLALDVVKELTDLYNNIEFCFTGEKPSVCNTSPYNQMKNIYFRKYSFDKMHIAYRDADIVIIPTIFSEGTSLSCLEAMASGKAIIASDVGGLPNLIIHGYNGLLIRPNRQELKNALVTLIDDIKLREMFGNNSLAVVEAFEKKRWKEKWINQLENFKK